MTNDTQFSVRLPADLVKRLDKMEAKLAKQPDMAAFRVTRQSVLRLALMRGLDALEEEHKGRG
jgi:predicted transcriptional regulator